MTIPTTSESHPTTRARIVILAILASGIGAFVYFDLGQYFSLESLKANRNSLLAYTNVNFSAVVTIYILIYIAQTGFSLPGAAVMTLVGGFLFGSTLGTLFANIGATTGATIAFLASRHLLREWVERKFGQRIEPIQAGFAKNAFSYLMTLRLIPAFPFFFVNLVAGLTRINLWTYILATSVGIIPGSFVFAYAGRQLGSINSLEEIASPSVLMALTLLGLLTLIPIAYRKFVEKKNS